MIVDNNEEITTGAEDRKMCSSVCDVAENLCSSESHDTCGDCGVDTKNKWLEILEFSHFVDFFSFTYVGKNHKKKELVRKITVVVALDLGCGNTKNPENESE